MTLRSLQLRYRGKILPTTRFEIFVQPAAYPVARAGQLQSDGHRAAPYFAAAGQTERERRGASALSTTAIHSGFIALAKRSLRPPGLARSPGLEFGQNYSPPT